MPQFTPSLACFLIVLGQLCLNCELNFKLTIVVSPLRHCSLVVKDHWHAIFFRELHSAPENRERKLSERRCAIGVRQKSLTVF